MDDVGKRIYDFALKIYPICRSITGKGVRKTFELIDDEIFQNGGVHLNIHEVPTGEEVFDWTIPKEWEIQGGYIEDEKGRRVIDFKNHNLHIMGYSAPVDQWAELNELKKYIYTQKDQPDVIPYVTSYYKERFGFCMSENQKAALKPGKYHMVIDSKLFDGNLTYGDIVISGDTEKEIFFSTYICHPSMANDNCSGIALAVELIKYVCSMKHRKYTYRFIFIPETIGAITYLKYNMDRLKANMYAGFNLTCVGDNKMYSMVETICGDTVADRVLRNILRNKNNSAIYPFIKRRSDERQYNMPGVDLPVVCFSRSKYQEYREYHTSADNMEFVSSSGFQGSYDVMASVIKVLEYNNRYIATILCEPQLGKRGLYPTVSQKGYNDAQILLDVLTFSNGNRDLIDISDKVDLPVEKLIPIVERLRTEKLLRIVDEDDKKCNIM